MITSTFGIRALRRALRERMPAEAFQPQPWRGVAAYVEMAAAGIVITAIVLAKLPWFANLLLSLVLGQMIVSVGLAAHEALHQSVFRSRRANQILGALGFAPLLVTPGLWVAWHVQAHHGSTNRSSRDPDALMDVDAYHHRWLARMRARMSPGHRHWLSIASLAYMFTLQGQVFLWVHCDEPAIRERVTLDRRRERILSVLLFAAWLALVALLGRNALWILVIPLLTANLTLMLYISTQHWIRPLVKDDDPVLTTVSVEVPRFFDWWHFGFSHHQEHHLFPRMSHKFGPLLRRTLREIEPRAVALLPLSRALRAAFATPALYRDDGTLVHEDGSGAVALDELAQSLDLPAFEISSTRARESVP
ncbi:Fatty acid desaturase [Minicystis rosea]|nr:Fatty acid desaturase [Minicystis rosea]